MQHLCLFIWFAWSAICSCVLQAADESPVAKPVRSGIGGAIHQPSAPEAVLTNSLGMKLVSIPAGDFQMGTHTPLEEFVAFGSNGSHPNEMPQHLVKISRPFYLGVTEVTQVEWKAVMGTDPWKGADHIRDGADYPASCVTWEDATLFCNKLTARERNAGQLGKAEVYRLPTEAEWEYACRAGTTGKFSFGNDSSVLNDFGWYGGLFGDGNAKAEPYAHQVGKKQANPWGLHDMHGNVCEWCQDVYDERFYARSPTSDPVNPSASGLRVLRGGGWVVTALGCRSAERGSSKYGLYGRNDLWGFRVVRGTPIK